MRPSLRALHSAQRSAARRCPLLRDTGDVSDDTWYYDLRRQRAVPADERGPGDDLLGPYPTKADAENWKAKVEERNEGWETEDEEWAHRGETDPE